MNTGFEFHPMHLHGFYFRVDSRSGLLADTLYATAERRLGRHRADQRRARR